MSGEGTHRERVLQGRERQYEVLEQGQGGERARTVVYEMRRHVWLRDEVSESRMRQGSG